jgi:hypothetical protein
MKRTLILAILLGFYYYSIAQKNYCEGYIITSNNDTIYGKVRDNFTFKLTGGTGKVSFVDSKGKEETYKAKEIVGYSKAGIANYLSIDIGLRHDFARIVVDGEVLLLSHKYTRTKPTVSSDTKMGTLAVSSATTEEVEDLYLYRRNSKKLTFVQDFNFKKNMADYFSDDPELKDMISNKELRAPDIEIIVQKYNKWKKDSK